MMLGKLDRLDGLALQRVLGIGSAQARWSQSGRCRCPFSNSASLVPTVLSAYRPHPIECFDLDGTGQSKKIHTVASVGRDCFP